MGPGAHQASLFHLAGTDLPTIMARHGLPVVMEAGGQPVLHILPMGDTARPPSTAQTAVLAVGMLLAGPSPHLLLRSQKGIWTLFPKTEGPLGVWGDRENLSTPTLRVGVWCGSGCLVPGALLEAGLEVDAGNASSRSPCPGHLLCSPHRAGTSSHSCLLLLP